MAESAFQVVEKPAPAGVEGAVVLGLVGSADVNGAHALEQALRKVVAQRPHLTVFDLSQMKYISSVGIGVLLNYRRHAEDWNGKVVLAAPSELVEGILRVSRLDSVLPIVPSVDLATL
jgi:anti-sigma B factor antagonist